MGLQGRKIVDFDFTKLITLLNKAYADEWLAYYQYWVGAQIIEGPMRGEAVKELLEHAQDELKHADMISNRIIQLGGKPLLSPQDWYKESTCGYKTPSDAFIKKVVEQNRDSEQCAIVVYNDMLKILRDTDTTTYFMIESILEDELGHEQDLENLLTDLVLIKKL